MSLESSIADLVAKGQALIETFTGKKNEINAAVQAAVAAAPLGRKVVYLDEGIGDDNNTGLSGSPVKTFEKAVSFGVMFGGLTIICSSDITNINPVTTVPYGCSVVVQGVVKSDGSNYSYKPQIVNNADGLSKRIACLAGSFFGLSVAFDRMDIVFPLNPQNIALQSAILFTSTFSGDSGCFIKIGSGGLVSEGRAGVLTGRYYSSLGLYLYNATFSSSDMSGRWISGVASGKLPTEYNDVFTNLTSL